MKKIMTAGGKIAALALMLALFGYLTLTADGALRASMVMSGNVVSALTMRAEEASAEDLGLAELPQDLKGTVYHIEENAPVDRASQTEMDNWLVKRFGPFRSAEHYQGQ